MMNFEHFALGCLTLCLAAETATFAGEKGADAADRRFQQRDLFDLEVASDPQISPDGSKVVFVRNHADIMKDRYRSELWIVDWTGENLRALTTGPDKASSPRWSPDGKRLVYTSSGSETSEIKLCWIDTGQTALVAHLQKSPTGLAWSPDGRWIAFTMTVPESSKPFAELPAKPEGAEWGKAPKVVQTTVFRHDGEGLIEDGYAQLFVVPSEGGTPRQLTRGHFNHCDYWSMSAPLTPIVWTPDGKSILLTGNRHADWEFDTINSEIYEVAVEDGAIRALTDRKGPDFSPTLSPDGTQIAYLGFDDKEQSYQITRLYVMNRDGSHSRVLLPDLDRDIRDPVWTRDGIYFQYDEKGNTKVALASLDGKVRILASDLGGVSHGRPYEGGSFTVAGNGSFAYTQTRPDYPADVAVGLANSSDVRRVTELNRDLLGQKDLATVEAFEFPSKADDRQIQAWIMKPPGFNSGAKYPMILEIHGGPFANYGDRFSSEMQVFASAGYVVVYANPRGSTSYGEEFGNLIHHAYPGRDVDDLMSAVDEVIAKGFVDRDRLYVTGGSGGGLLTSWIVGKTDRFRAAVVAKPVINFSSFALTTDDYPYFPRYWFGSLPWEKPDDYFIRSPLSLVGNVKTPTMLIVGEADHRTPISEAEQFFAALKLRKVDAALVRLPDAPHSMNSRPTQLIAKVAHILKWFGKYAPCGRTDRRASCFTLREQTYERTFRQKESSRSDLN